MTKGVLQGPRLLLARRCCVQSMRAPCWCSCWEPPTWGQTTHRRPGQRTRSQEQNTEQRTTDFGRVESPDQLFDRIAFYFLVLCHKRAKNWYDDDDDDMAVMIDMMIMIMMMLSTCHRLCSGRASRLRSGPGRACVRGSATPPACRWSGCTSEIRDNENDPFLHLR